MLKSFIERIAPCLVNRKHAMPKDQIGIARTEQYVDDRGVVQNRIVFDTSYRTSDQYRVVDFNLQNLIAAGVQLKEVLSLNGSSLSDADIVIDNVEQLNSTSNEQN